MSLDTEALSGGQTRAS